MDESFDNLKRMVAEAEEFGPVMTAFLDLMEARGPAGSGTRLEGHSLLESVIRLLGQQIHGKGCQISHVLLCRIPEHGFIHGGFAINGHFCALFYFEDIDVGLAGIPVPNGETRVARFSSELPGADSNGHSNGNGHTGGNGRGGPSVRPMLPEEKRRLRKRLKERLKRAKRKKGRGR